MEALIEVEVYDHESESWVDKIPMDCTLTQFFSALAKVVAQIPVEFVENAKIEIEAEPRDSDYSTLKFRIFYHRPETSKERIERHAVAARMDEDKARRDRKEYERLKKIFGDKK